MREGVSTILACGVFTVLSVILPTTSLAYDAPEMSSPPQTLNQLFSVVESALGQIDIIFSDYRRQDALAEGTGPIDNCGPGQNERCDYFIDEQREIKLPLNFKYDYDDPSGDAEDYLIYCAGRVGYKTLASTDGETVERDEF
ncbi:MAG: hypothetical protein M5R36_16980 [Deltaproteobacteria bacterium]|nr:hypothetical protein [Deltaproteobacteria bacterium]